jgi:hypothetical protein
MSLNLPGNLRFCFFFNHRWTQMNTDQTCIASVALRPLGFQEAYQRPSLVSVFIRVHLWC